MIDIDLDTLGRNIDKRRFDRSATIPGFEITIGKMRDALHALHERIGGPRRKPGLLTAPLRPWRGVMYWSLALLAAWIFLSLAVVAGDVDLDGTPAWAVYVGLGLAAAFYLGLRGAVCFRTKAETLLALDGRRPVVYLRSFHDDESMVGRPVSFTLDVFRWRYMLTEYSRGGLLRLMFRHGDVRLEQAIEDDVRGIGPFIAIGEPHERHPDFGATRAYFEGVDVAWRDAVRSWIDAAALVVVIPGRTHGLGWELATIQTGKHTSKLLLVFPPEPPEARASRLAALAGMITDRELRDSIAAPATTDLLAVFSTPGGDLVRVCASKPKLAQLQFAVELALYGMFCLSPART